MLGPIPRGINWVNWTFPTFYLQLILQQFNQYDNFIL